ncbi:hypothetical protein BBD42_26970 [Paenibacillus sp. BIHB 4019]|uniref:Uncharacterized protein n=1 Tax=Paenibacillus sp. BIHB 4019 TaxID=1870819 RepID=A0A1B2DPT4_9BACL|nr:hypothetical protein [Paenibacillus sp. BIHB 4019]ANY69726.1 hypothetical protein BBD42_26970 [Paenibacillus sp. BIHB 4019]
MSINVVRRSFLFAGSTDEGNERECCGLTLQAASLLDVPGEGNGESNASDSDLAKSQNRNSVNPNRVIRKSNNDSAILPAAAPS